MVKVVFLISLISINALAQGRGQMGHRHRSGQIPRAEFPSINVAPASMQAATGAMFVQMGATVQAERASNSALPLQPFAQPEPAMPASPSIGSAMGSSFCVTTPDGVHICDAPVSSAPETVPGTFSNVAAPGLVTNCTTNSFGQTVCSRVAPNAPPLNCNLINQHGQRYCASEENARVWGQAEQARISPPDRIPASNQPARPSAQ